MRGMASVGLLALLRLEVMHDEEEMQQRVYSEEGTMFTENTAARYEEVRRKHR